jgi:hypothetical protein
MQPAVVTPGDSRSLAQFGQAEIISLLAGSGAVHFSGFGVGTTDFADYSDQFSEFFTCDPHKVVANSWNGAPGLAGQVARRATRTVKRARAKHWPVHDAAPARFAPFTGYGLNPHNENSYLPAAFPDLVWFHCSRPSASGGSTILLDGGELLERLDAPAEEFLRDQPIRYLTTLLTAQWQATWGVDDQPALRRLLDAEPGVTYELAASGQLDVNFDSTQIFPRLFDGSDVVRSNLLSMQPFDRINPTAAEKTTAGELIPVEVLNALIDGAQARTEIDLAAGDVILIDNSRVMHGRTPFADEARRIETRCAWLRPELLNT